MRASYCNIHSEAGWGVKCRTGPLDGVDIPDFDREFFMLVFYSVDATGDEVRHVYGRIGGEWHYQPKATLAANTKEPPHE